MAISNPTSVKTGASASGTSLPLTTLAAAVAAGNLVIVSLVLNAAGAISIADTKGNTYVAGPDSGLATVRAAIFYCLSATALLTTDTITVTYPSGQCIASVVQCVTGFTTNAADVSAHATGSSTALSTGATGTRTAASELLWCVGGANITGSSTIAAGSNIAWTLLDSSIAVGSGGVTDKMSTEYFIAAATGTDAGAMTASVTGPWAAAILTFKDAGGGGAGPLELALTGVG